MSQKIRKKLSNVLKEWGLGEAEAEIFATLATSGGLTAKEISDELGYAYSTTINCLNNLRRMGYVERSKEKRKFIYFANTDFAGLVEREIKKMTSSLKEIVREIHKLEDRYRNKLKELAVRIEKAIKYIEGKGLPEGLK